MNTPRTTFVVYDGNGEIITASRDVIEAREIGEDCAEFNPQDTFTLSWETLQ